MARPGRKGRCTSTLPRATATSSYATGIVLGQRYYHEGMDPVIKEKDEQAERVLQECFPDRKVVMIDSFALNLMGGGVHCWTKDVAAAATVA